MFKCRKCGKRLERIIYFRHGMKRHYFVCSCGWTNKPKDLEENVVEAKVSEAKDEE